MNGGSNSSFAAHIANDLANSVYDNVRIQIVFTLCSKIRWPSFRSQSKGWTTGENQHQSHRPHQVDNESRPCFYP